MGQNGREESLCRGMCNDIFCRSPPAPATTSTTPQTVIGHKKGRSSSQEIHGQKSESGHEQDDHRSPSVGSRLHLLCFQPAPSLLKSICGPEWRENFSLLSCKSERHASLQLLGPDLKSFTSAPDPFFLSHLYLQCGEKPVTDARRLYS